MYYDIQFPLYNYFQLISQFIIYVSHRHSKLEECDGMKKKRDCWKVGESEINGQGLVPFTCLTTLKYQLTVFKTFQLLLLQHYVQNCLFEKINNKNSDDDDNHGPGRDV